MMPRFRAAVCCCLLFAGCWLSPLRAQNQPPTSPDTVVDAESCDIHSTDAETISIFTGNVTVTGNNIRITCDRLEVVSLRAGDKQDMVGKQERFQSLIATGKVRIIQGDREATCGRAEVLPGENRITLTGRPMVVDHGNNTIATGEPLVLYRGDRRIHGSNVQIILPPLKNLGFDKKQPPPTPTVGLPPSS